MRAKLVKHINFKRGVPSKKAMGVGLIQQIESWLKNLDSIGGIGKYIINDDYSISVEGIVDLRELRELPHGNLPEYINFREIKKLLNYGDQSIWRAYLSAPGIDLTSLRGMPKFIEGDFVISNNNLGDLIGCPKKIVGNLFAKKAGLSSLEGAPDYVGKNVYFFGNPGKFTEAEIRKTIKYIGGEVILSNKW